MNIFVLLGFILFLPLVLFAAYLVLSSCLGDSFRARLAGVPVDVQQATYGRTYTRNFGSGAGHGGWEQIEMEDMMEPALRDIPEEEYDLRSR